MRTISKIERYTNIAARKFEAGSPFSENDSSLGYSEQNSVWYTVAGNTAWNSSNVGTTQQITGHITETPLFFRGGYIIPTLLNPEGTLIEESLGGTANYTLIVALAPRKNSIGKLDVMSPHAENETHYVDFEARLDTTNNTFVLSVNATCGSPNSTAEDATIRTTIY
ncbi:unnamed protein product [Orchesella dallaii]|uniref:Uncharacterized protein n=1 Tax=Orchesella dallaii TaxID=48710 RepID=A0ABP1R5W5_9HEXA